MLSVKDNQKSSKSLSQRFETSVYWNEYETKNENKNMKNEYRYFLESNFVGINRFFVLVYSDQDENSKSYKAKMYYLWKVFIKNYNTINVKNFYDQPVDFDIMQYEEIRRLITGQGEDYTTGCLFE